MHEILESIDSIAEKIKNLEEKREKLGRFLREVKDGIELRGQVIEKRIVYKVETDRLEKKKVVAIDGGLSKHEYHGLDIILTRAVGVIFDYSNGKLEKVQYFPSALVSPKILVVSDPYSDEEFSISSSLERQRAEIELAIQAINKFSPSLLLLDGSVVPHGNDKPGFNSAAWRRYEAVIEAFKKLYKSSSGSLLAGCVEDSRGRRFCEIMSEQVLGQINDPRIPELQKILAGTRDTNLLYHVLSKGERTAVFRYSKDAEEHPILADLGEYGKRIYCFYLKSAEFDRPVRIDYYCKGNLESVISAANAIASMVLGMTPHSSYGCPAPLIEADFRAKMQEKDATILHDQLVDRVGITPSLMRLRREQRPF